MELSGTPSAGPAGAALNDDQQRVLDYYLGPRTGDELEPPVAAIQVTKRQLAFLLAAIDHFHATACPLARAGNDAGAQGTSVCCELREWYEAPGSGAMALGCFDSCAAWRDALIQDVVPAAFHITGAPPVHRPEAVAAAREAAAAAAARREAQQRAATVGACDVSPARPPVRITTIDTSEPVVPAI